MTFYALLAAGSHTASTTLPACCYCSQAAADRARKEVLFWKDQLDHAVDEKNALLERYTELYRHTFALEHAVSSLGTENTELRHVLDRTAQHESRGAPTTPTSQGSGSSTPVSAACPRLSVSYSQ